MIDLKLPNNILIKDLTVTELDNPVDKEGNKLEPFGFVIGMEVIGCGDFSITNMNNKTMMSFRIPSQHEIDFVTVIKADQEIVKRHIAESKTGKNAKCLCYSGKTFRECHGKYLTYEN